MNRETLKWALPLLQAWSEGETLQVKCEDTNKWVDWLRTSTPLFDLSPQNYRIKPDLKTAGQILYEKTLEYPLQSNSTPWKFFGEPYTSIWETRAQAVIQAYKQQLIKEI